MINAIQPLCPCCSHPLLRHASYQRSYWFCRQCHQEMPDIENLVKPRLVPQHWANQALERQYSKTGLQDSEKLYFSLEDHKNVQRLVFSDSLTKTANRLKFKVYLEQEWQLLAQQASLSLILGNLDFFQAYNNQYGHQEGDRCLLKVAQAIKSVVQDGALVPAAGGEEFVIILPRTKAAGAHRVAQEILAKVHSLKIPHLSSEISPYLTLSLGVASIIPCDQYSADLLINAAAQALHQAKARGRDRLIIHENLLQQITIIEPKTTVLPPRYQDKSLSTNDFLMSYVAYYLSRGKSVISLKQGSLPFETLVYQYSGYQKQFEEFWQQLQQRRDFCDLFLDGDFYSFGQLLDGNCTIGECARCSLPTPMSVGRALTASNCTLCIEPSTASQFEQPILEQKSQSNRTQIIAIGKLPADAQNLQKLFFRNGIEVTFVPTPDDLSCQMSSTADMVMILGEISEAAGKVWAQELSHYRQFSQVPIVAFSSQAGHGLPWMDKNLGIADYLLTPYNSDRLAAHLRQMPQAQLQTVTTEPHWFPR